MYNCNIPPHPAPASLLPSPALFSTESTVWHTGTVHSQRKLPEGRDWCPFCPGLCLQHPEQSQAQSRGSANICWISDASPSAPSMPAITGMCDYHPLPSSLPFCTHWKATLSSGLDLNSSHLFKDPIPARAPSLCPAVAVSLYWLIPFHMQIYPHDAHFLKKESHALPATANFRHSPCSNLLRKSCLGLQGQCLAFSLFLNLPQLHFQQ